MNTHADKTQANKRQSVAIDIAQRQGGGETTFQFEDNRPEVIVQRKLQEIADNSPQARKAAQLHAMTDNHSAQQEHPILKKKNKTGLPDDLKTGMENLSGYPMDDVKVHYNSDKPAQLNAHAYAQGTDIHLASGQEKHLPHEAWHVVQQKQGRVKAAMQMKDGLSVNDDKSLEHEADVMGQQASEMTHAEPGTLQARSSISSKVLQRVFVTSTNTKALIAEQAENQNYPDSYRKSFTTVGFEHEFAQMQGSDHDLKNVTHVELSKSAEILPFTGLGFSLETDADNALELVSPPFIIETMDDKPIPKSADVKKVDNMIKADLTNLANNSTNIGELLGNFPATMGLNFATATAKIESSNINASTPSSVRGATKNEANQIAVGATAINNIPIKLSMKTGKPNISSQVNFATDAGTYDTVKKMSEPSTHNTFVLFQNLEQKLHTVLSNKMNVIGHPSGYYNPVLNDKMIMFIKELSRNFSQTFAVPSVKKVEDWKEEMFKGDVPSNQLANKLDGSDKDIYDLHTGIRSYVKDISGIWLKDTVMNFGLGILSNDQWMAIFRLSLSEGLVADLQKAANTVSVSSFNKKQRKEVQENITAMGAELEKSRLGLARMITAGYWHHQKTDLTNEDGGSNTRAEFGSHDPKWLGVRQDTFIPKAYVKRAAVFSARTLHVVEARGDAIETIENLEIAEKIRNTDKNDKLIASEMGVEENRVARIRATL